MIGVSAAAAGGHMRQPTALRAAAGSRLNATPLTPRLLGLLRGPRPQCVRRHGERRPGASALLDGPCRRGCVSGTR